MRLCLETGWLQCGELRLVLVGHADVELCFGTSMYIFTASPAPTCWSSLRCPPQWEPSCRSPTQGSPHLHWGVATAGSWGLGGDGVWSACTGKAHLWVHCLTGTGGFTLRKTELIGRFILAHAHIKKNIEINPHFFPISTGFLEMPSILLARRAQPSCARPWLVGEKGTWQQRSGGATEETRAAL